MASTGSHKSLCSECSRQWERLEIARKRLTLQQERLELDQELIKAEKKKLKRSSKLASRIPSRKNSIIEGKSLKEQVAKYQQQLAQQEKELQKLQSLTTTATKQDDENFISKQEHEQEINDFQQQLGAIQRSLAAICVERDNVQRDRDQLKERLESAAIAEKSQVAAVVVDDGKCNHLQLKLEEVEDSLQKMKKLYSAAQAAHAEEKQEWKERLGLLQQQSKLEEKRSYDSADDGRLKRLEQENELLQQENLILQQGLQGSHSAQSPSASISPEELEDLQRENERLKLQLAVQEQQMEEDKAKFGSKNKFQLMEKDQYRKDNEQLKKELKVMESRYHEQQELANEIQMTKDALVQQRERELADLKRLQIEHAASKNEQETRSKLESRNRELLAQLQNKKEEIYQLKNNSMNKNRLLSDNKSDSNAGASSTSQPTPQSVVIPSDLPNQSDRKHVVEWEWHGPTFAGVYTGWLDLTGNPDGTGTLRIEDGSIYDGDWQRGLRHGTLRSCFGCGFCPNFDVFVRGR